MTIPAILAGPVIRRVSRENAFFWLVTSEDFPLNMEVYQVVQVNGSSFQYKKLAVDTKSSTIRMGEHLYIHLLQVNPDELFPTNTLLAYNIFFMTNQGRLNLQDFHLLEKDSPKSIVYGELDYPTFFIPHSTENQLLYGSCRKAHGEGEDLFIGADHYIKEKYMELTQRPSNLFLVGDQIYADDIPDPLFPIIQELSKNIMGNWEEKLQYIDPRIHEEPIRSAINQVHGRQYLVEHFCNFTTNHGHNHLLTFGEYAAMYILNYSPAVWEDIEIPAFESIRDNNQLYFVYKDSYRYENERIKEFENHELRYRQQRKSVQEWKDSLYAVRRVMANTPTYMMFDDHDITDDWNISQNWVNNVWNSPLGRHVIANALTAFFAFQGYGNDPRNFSKEFIANIQSYLESLADTPFMIDEEIYQEWLNQMWKFESWFFLAPTSPPALFLDTRTMRHFTASPMPFKIGRTIDETSNSPELISEDAWKKINDRYKQYIAQIDGPIILVSPVPLYGIGLIETVVQQYVMPFRLLGLPVHYQFDMEAWKYNGKGFHNFINQLMHWKKRNYIILSGDSHIASSVKSNIEYGKEHTFHVYQFTSSPIKNMSFSGFFGRLLKSAIWFNALKRKKRMIHRICDENYQLTIHKEEHKGSLPERWKEKIQYFQASNGDIVYTKNNIGILSVHSHSIQNKLIIYDGKKTSEMSFTKVHLE
jgi:hypothetical protein